MSERFAALAAKYKDHNAVALANGLDSTDKALEAASAVKTSLECEKEFLRIRLAEKLTEEGLKNITLESGARYRIQDEMFVSATAEAKPRVIELLKESGNGAVVKEDFNAMTFKSLVKGLAPDESGMPNPLLAELLEAGVKLRVTPMARRY